MSRWISWPTKVNPLPGMIYERENRENKDIYQRIVNKMEGMCEKLPHYSYPMCLQINIDCLSNSY
jgi:hypothetical protein